jgi:CBS domain containing-hemolysin-like protein
LQSLKEGRFQRLILPVCEFLSQVRREQGRSVDFAVSVTESATMSQVLKLVSEQRVHRVFVVDDKKKPIGVISLTDILEQLAA